MILTCHAASQLLSRDSGDFYLTIFAQKFDFPALVYRLDKSELRDNAKLELHRRFKFLKLFRSLDNLKSPHLTEAFWMAYCMLEDSDTSQKNVRQLLHVGLSSFLDGFLRKHLYDDAEANNGWPELNECNSLAIALAWHLSSNYSVKREGDHQKLLSLIAPFVFAAFRYSIFTSHEIVFNLEDSRVLEATSSTVHGEYPPKSLPAQDVLYFGNVKRKARVPSAPVFAILLYFSRSEVAFPNMIPPHLETRDEVGIGYRGIAVEDVKYFIERCRTRFSDPPALDVGIMSQPLDRAVLGQPTPYKLGNISGNWQGSVIFPMYDAYTQWMNNLKAPNEYITTGREPLYLTFKEHFTCDKESRVPIVDDSRNGMRHAWLPEGLKYTETPHGIVFTDESGNFETSYDTFRFGEGLERKEIVDVIITGKTEGPHADAWGSVEVLGRIRLGDGLVVFLKNTFDGKPADLMRGYVISSQNLIGRSKGYLSTGLNPAGFEFVFSLSKDLTMMIM